MKIKVYVIDLELSRWSRKALAYVGLPVALLLVMSATVRADSVSVQTFASGETLSSAKLNADFQALVDAMNNYPDCPRGYAKDNSVTSYVVCKKGVDEVVKVGTGASAFWVDRYEASIWSDSAGTKTQYGGTGDNYPGTFPDTGQWTVPLYAVSEPGVLPSGSVTWFQAVEACAASGKRLPDVREWMRAVQGTPDDTTKCNTNSGTVRMTGQGSTCVSYWGAQDMVGNMWEWTSQWSASPTGSQTPPPGVAPWPSSGVTGSYGADVTLGIESYAYQTATGPYVKGLPAVVVLGGDSAMGATEGGVFSVSLRHAPSAWDTQIGVRCVIPGN